MDDPLLALYVRFLIAVVASTVSYMLIVEPLFRRGLIILDDSKVPWRPPVTSALRRTRMIFAICIILSFQLLALAAWQLHANITPALWSNYAMPTCVGAAFGVMMVLVLNADRLREPPSGK